MLLSLREVSKRYRGPGGKRLALDELSLELGRGQMVGVFGPSGSGKTTLLRTAAGLQAPDSGAVFYDGERLDRMRNARRSRLRRREIACVWTQPRRERLTALEHVSVPLLVDRLDRHVAQRRAREALLACEAEHCAEIEMHELSDGEHQRVEIARAIVIEPRLLLADGVASSLSLLERETIMALLSSLAREAKVAVLLADSDAEALIGADGVLYLNQGRLSGHAPPTDTPARAEDEVGATVYPFPGESRRAADG